MNEYPAQKKVWEQRTAWILRDFQSTAKSTKRCAEAFLEFANGDTTCEIVTHFCITRHGNTPACCASDEEALCKLLSRAVPLFCKGFQTPLLYRMKHYAPASSYMKLAGSCFNLLPRILAELEHAATERNADLAQQVDTFMHDAGESGAADLEEGDWQQRISDMLDADQDFAAQNGARRRKVIAQITQPSFYQSSIVIDCFIQPLEYGINFLMSRTKIWQDLNYMGRGHPEYEKLCNDSRAKFLHAVSGKLGDKMLSMYTALLDHGLKELSDMGFEPSTESLNRMFRSFAVLCTDLHRRFKQEFRQPPFTLFEICDLNTADFVAAWTALEAQAAMCSSSKCVDREITRVLLKQFSGLQSKPLEEQQAQQAEIQELLRDISTWSPLTSDTVELKNGQVQWVVSKRASQNVRSTSVAKELSLLTAAVTQNQWAQSAIGVQTMPAKATSAGVLKMAGVKAGPVTRL